MSETEPFDWNPLGEIFWRAAAESCTHKPTEGQVKFAVGRHNGLTSLDSCRRAGYPAINPERLRQQGSRVNKSTAVQELLAYAYAQTGTGDDGILDGPEAKRILSRIARTGDNNARINAVKGLETIKDTERERREADNGPGDPADALKSIFAIAPELAAKLAYAQGLDVVFEMTNEQRAEIEQQRMVQARVWIEEHPDQAAAFLEMKMRNGGGHYAEDADGMGESNAAI